MVLLNAKGEQEKRKGIKKRGEGVEKRERERWTATQLNHFYQLKRLKRTKSSSTIYKSNKKTKEKSSKKKSDTS